MRLVNAPDRHQATASVLSLREPISTGLDREPAPVRFNVGEDYYDAIGRGSGC